MANVIDIPARRRGGSQTYTHEQLRDIAQAIPNLSEHEAVLIADADTEYEARYAARTAQEELRRVLDLNTRTRVFKHEGRWRSALRPIPHEVAAFRTQAAEATTAERTDTTEA